MATYYINIQEQTVTTDGNTCNFIEAGLYENTDTQRIYTDKEEITDAIQENEPRAKVIFE